MNSQNNAIPHPGRRNAKAALRLRLAGRVVETVDGVWSVSHSQTAYLSHAENANTAFHRRPHAALTKLWQYTNVTQYGTARKTSSQADNLLLMMRLRCLLWLSITMQTQSCYTAERISNAKQNSRPFGPRKTDYRQPNHSNNTRAWQVRA